MAKQRELLDKSYAKYLAGCKAGLTRQEYADKYGFASVNSLNQKLTKMKQEIEKRNATRPEGADPLPWPSLKDARGVQRINWDGLAAIVAASDEDSEENSDTIAELNK